MQFTTKYVTQTFRTKKCCFHIYFSTDDTSIRKIDRTQDTVQLAAFLRVMEDLYYCGETTKITNLIQKISNYLKDTGLEACNLTYMDIKH